ncbi:hypothetical protein I306_05992 [Cryptococcus gattii EJB2]|uniref:Uncharacterized protein n=1 Tax=Cryptococcus gattii EJB2 TaxID=1296103 RepID=A0ABR5BN23_9TREE|nr:hypothetical protein I306_05992 [Cryptococcus gattii EJB2]
MPPEVYQDPVLAAHLILQAHVQNRFIETPVADDVLSSLNEYIFHLSSVIPGQSMTRNCDAVRSFITAVHEAQAQDFYKDLLEGQSSLPGERGARGTTGPAGSQDSRTPSGAPAPLGITKEEILVLFKEFMQEIKTMLDDSHAALKMDIEKFRKEIKKAPIIQDALWYEYYHDEVPEGGPFGEAGVVLTDRQLREAILLRLIPYVLRDGVLSD